MRCFPLRSALLLATLAVVLAAWWAPAQANTWPPRPSRLYLVTPQGQLRIVASDYIYEARLQFEGRDVQPDIRGLLNITYAFKTEHTTAALLSISTGNAPCDIHYRWILLRADGYELSPQFGSCSEHIRVSADERGYTLSTPNPLSAELIDVYHYDGKQITRTQQSATADAPATASGPATSPP